MVKRLVVGLVLGFLVGLAVAAALTHGAGIAFVGSFGAIAAYVSAAVVGALTGLVAGKPIWSTTGKIEAGLKAFFGALIAAGLMFAARRWLAMPIDFSFLGGEGTLGEIPYASLPPIAALLGAFFEVDNTPEPQGKEASDAPRQRVALDAPREELDEEEPATAQKARRR